jgi:hypothetical protein
MSEGDHPATAIFRTVIRNINKPDPAIARP